MGKQHLLALRFSALGDVLMTVPVIDALARQYPDLSISMVSRPFVGSIFRCLPENVHFVGINPRQYPGLKGLHRLLSELKKLKPDVVCDLHDVLRTKFIRTGFRVHGIPVASITKDRSARRQFLSERPHRQQVTAVERYLATLERLGYPVDMSQAHPIYINKEKAGIGIAPFAAHQGKVYPEEMMEEVIALLSRQGHRICLFGAGDKENALTARWAARYPGVENMIGRLPDMAAEAQFIASLQVMLTMDSGNMHLAALTDTPVISIWGATHPLGGFLGWRQKMEHVIAMDDMDCRPCSIYGNKPCRQGNYPCLRRITPASVVERINAVLCS